MGRRSRSRPCAPTCCPPATRRSGSTCVVGMVEETIPAEAPERIALLRLDTDWYASTKHELETLYPRLVNGGVLIVDDYGHYEGARQAVDEYFAETGERVLLNRIDYTGRVAVKQPKTVRDPHDRAAASRELISVTRPGPERGGRARGVLRARPRRPRRSTSSSSSSSTTAPPTRPRRSSDDLAERDRASRWSTWPGTSATRPRSPPDIDHAAATPWSRSTPTSRTRPS